MKPKICIVSSCGGHLTEARAFQSTYADRPHFYVLNDRVPLPDDMKDKTYFIRHSERDWLVFVNLWEAWLILRNERPDIIFSTGAGPAVPFALVGKLFGVRCVYVESLAQVTQPSLTGRIMYRLADRFFYQWKTLDHWFPRGTYGGLLT